MAPSQYTQILLANRPTGFVTDETLKIQTGPFDLQLGTEEALIRVDYLSLDPSLRMLMNDVHTHVPPLQLGDRMSAQCLGTIIEIGRDSKFSIGDVVTTTFDAGMRDYAVLKDSEMTKIFLAQGTEPLDNLGPVGITGLSAYFGLFDIGKIKAGETLVVSGAAGATGSIACQIGKIVGCKVIGITGSDEKCEWLEKELGVDKALNYKNADFEKNLMTPSDLSTCILTMSVARIVVCGAISLYNGDSLPATGIASSYMNLVKQRARMEGFIVLDYADQYTTACNEIAKWIAEGKMKRRFTILKGLSKVVEGMNMLFTGGNTGKLVIQVHDTAP